LTWPPQGNKLFHILYFTPFFIRGWIAFHSFILKYVSKYVHLAESEGL